MGKDLRAIYTAPTETAARETLRRVRHQIGSASTRLWPNPWGPSSSRSYTRENEARRVICSTDPIESPNTRYRQAVKARGHLPNDAAVLKRLYLVIGSLEPTRGGRTRSAIRRKPALDTFALPLEAQIN